MFTHRGRSDLYIRLIGGLVRIRDGNLLVAPDLEPAQKQLLRRHQPHLYLHLYDRVANQFLVASLDAKTDLIPELAQLGDRLLSRLDDESDLHFAKRSQEITALAGTLSQHHTFLGRHEAKRPSVVTGKTRGQMAIQFARPHERDRDVNYWIQAVLTDWTLFAEEASHEPGYARDHDGVVTELRGSLDRDPDDPYNLMVASLAAAVASAFFDNRQIADWIADQGAGPTRIARLMAEPQYHDAHHATYALCLAAGFAALAQSSADDAEKAALDETMARAADYFDQFAFVNPSSSVLALVGLKFAACRIWHLATTGRSATASEIASRHTEDLKNSPPDCIPDRVSRFFREYRITSGVPDRRAVLKIVLSLPY